MQVRGYGMSGDAHHITQPPPDGIGAQLAMRRALSQAGLAPDQVCYINAHATSTPQGGWVGPLRGRSWGLELGGRQDIADCGMGRRSQAAASRHNLARRYQDLLVCHRSLLLL